MANHPNRKLPHRYYALVQESGMIYGIGTSPSAARRNAKRYWDPGQEDELDEVGSYSRGFCGRFEENELAILPCSHATYLEVKRSGGDVGWDRDHDGVVILCDEQP